MKLIGPLLLQLILLAGCSDRPASVTAPQQPQPPARFSAELTRSMLAVRGERFRFFGGDAMPTSGIDGETASPSTTWMNTASI